MSKIVLVVTVLVVVASAVQSTRPADFLTDAEKAEFLTISKECTESSGVSEEVLTKSYMGEIIDNPELKKHLFCVWKKTGVIDESSEVDKEKLKESLMKAMTEEESDKLLEKCVVKKETGVDTVFSTTKCLRENTKDIVMV